MYEFDFLRSLLKTVLIEGPALYLLLRYAFHDQKTPFSKILGGGVFASVMTLPYLWFIAPLFLKNFLVYVVVGEIAVFLFEALFYYLYFPMNIKRALICSLLCNIASLGIGQLL